MEILFWFVGAIAIFFAFAYFRMPLVWWTLAAGLILTRNIFRSFAFFRRVFDEVAERYPDVEANHVYVDACAMMLVRQPEAFDVLVSDVEMPRSEAPAAACASARQSAGAQPSWKP